MYGTRKRSPTVQATFRVPVVPNKAVLQAQMMEEIRGNTAWVKEQLEYLQINLSVTEDTRDPDKLQMHLDAIAYLKDLLKEIPSKVYSDYQILYGKNIFPDIEEPPDDTNNRDRQ